MAALDFKQKGKTVNRLDAVRGVVADLGAHGRRWNGNWVDIWGLLGPSDGDNRGWHDVFLFMEMYPGSQWF